MLPFVHLGPYTFGTYGIMMATGGLVGFYLYRAAAHRQQVSLNTGMLIFAIALSGPLASKLYLIVESPGKFLAHPAQLWQRTGFSFYGGLLGVLVIIPIVARLNRVTVLTLLDLLSPAAVMVYGIGRLGCFLAGDGDYGTPTSLPWGLTYPRGIVPTTVPVHPTELYEFVVAAVITRWLWRLADPRASVVHPVGGVFAQYLILTGMARFAFEFIKRNPPVLLGLTNAQVVSAFLVVSGTILLFRLRVRRSAHPDGTRGVEGAHQDELELLRDSFTDRDQPLPRPT